MEKIDWERLRIFHKIADIGNFLKASEILHISPSALSRQISLLEKALGCFLFKRIPRGLALTLEGEILYKSTKEIILCLATAEMALLENKDSLQGIIRIEAPPILGTFWLPSQLLEFSSHYPNIHFKLIFTEKKSDFFSKKTDISISPFSCSNPEVVNSDPIQIPSGLYASAHYLKTYGIPQKTSDLDHHRLIIIQNMEKKPPSLSHLRWILEIGRPQGSPRPLSVSLNSFQGLYYATKNGMGIAQLPKFCTCLEDTFIELLPETPKPLFPLYVVCSKQAFFVKRNFVFRNFILKKLIVFFISFK